MDEILSMQKENLLASIIVDLCYHIHCQYGPGLLESVYERILAYELVSRGHKVEVQKVISLVHDELFFIQHSKLT